MRPLLTPRSAAADDAVVASPCVSLCAMDAASGLCVGCLRTLEEIACWSALDAGGKRAILARLPARRAQLDGRAAERVTGPATEPATEHDSERN